ncbi:MAG TPA: GNAT family N-acetyltransferase [Symbiobacteriaceae bacterium]|nr:GNAT family N-acetyltransferase [Symbiobacteriaceae bacterium]
MQFSIRPAQVPEDYKRIAAIASTGGWEAVTTDMLAQEDANFPADALRHRLVAVDRTDWVIGYGCVVRQSYDAPGYFAIKVTVDPTCRRAGVGSALLGQLEEWARDRGATHFEAKFRDDTVAFLAFAHKHWYREVGHPFGCIVAKKSPSRRACVGP